MSRALVLPNGTRPSNLQLPDTVRAMPIDSDLYDICSRLKELSDRLHVVLLENGGDSSWAIMESCLDGVERLIFKCDRLDGTVIKRLQKIMSVPLDARYEQLEKENYRFQQQHEADELDRLYESMGRPMWTELDRCGFIDNRPVSYPKSPKKQAKGRLPA